jgi:hypothetical protein
MTIYIDAIPNLGYYCYLQMSNKKEILEGFESNGDDSGIVYLHD